MLAVILTVIVAVGVGVAIERRSNAAAHRVRQLALQTMLWVLVPFVAYVNIARLHLSVDAGLSIAVGGAAFVTAGALMAWLGQGQLALVGATLLDVPAPFLLLAAMPTGVNTLVVAHATGLDLRLVASSIVWTTTLALPVVAVLDVVGVLG